MKAQGGSIHDLRPATAAEIADFKAKGWIDGKPPSKELAAKRLPTANKFLDSTQIADLAAMGIAVDNISLASRSRR
jgi:hypothetical protein